MNMKKLELYAQRCLDANKPIQLLIDMPGFEAPELIVNPPENIEKKMEYYKATYDENCKHKHAEGIRIIDVVFDDNQEGITILPTELQVGHVRFTKTTYVGDLSNDVVIEGSTDDVLKILEAKTVKNFTSDITFNIAPGEKVEEVANSIKDAIANAVFE